MVDLEKEREEFIKVYAEICGEHDQLWQGWKKRAELAQENYDGFRGDKDNLIKELKMECEDG